MDAAIREELELAISNVCENLDRDTLRNHRAVVMCLTESLWSNYQETVNKYADITGIMLEVGNFHATTQGTHEVVPTITHIDIENGKYGCASCAKQEMYVSEEWHTYYMSLISEYKACIKEILRLALKA